MECRFYKNNSDNIVVNKNLTLLTTKTIVLKEDTSIITPTIILAYDNNVIKSNYIYITELGRYYFINNVTCSQNRIIIDCDCDELFTYKNEILNSKAVIKRQENQFNTYLNDEKYKAYEYSRIQTKYFPSGFTNESFILAVAGL